jgi:NADP-dependent 3-hydroxy acid dehydrogenase YdfG
MPQASIRRSATLANRRTVIFSVKPFAKYTVDEFRSLVSTNLEGFIFITQLAVKQILAQGTGGW